MKKAIFPGSFDPITKGHESVIRRALPLFDEIIVGIGVNSTKKYMFSLEQRQKWIEETFANEPKIKVIAFEGLTIDFCAKHDIQFILRGLRTSPDFEFERAIAHMNKSMQANVETVFLLTAQEFSAISSTIVREVLKNGGDVASFVPSGIEVKL